MEASPPDSYSNPNYRVSVHVYEGSPVKGIVFVNRAKGYLYGIDCMGKIVLKYDFGPGYF